MKLRLKPTVVSFMDVAGSYFPQSSGSQFGMPSRVTWEISLSPDTHTASNSLHPDNKNLRRPSQYFLSSLDPKRNLGSRPLTQRDSWLWVDRILMLLTLDASSVCTVLMFQKRDGSFYL